MKLNRRTWGAVTVVAVAFLLVHLICWQPGIGGTRGRQPPGAELERYFGWPAQHQAEHWRSDDVDLIMRINAVAHFYDPHGEIPIAWDTLNWRVWRPEGTETEQASFHRHPESPQN